eukprot:GHVU01172570.1.p1 GENE.GHVU01172570.1~~GHVU01172570.1.p1  ORF type:complete len:173 (-),score=20.98 GHVU01172570.1:958-1476(-)
MGAGLKVDAVHPVRVFVVAAVPHYLRRNYPHCVYRSLRLLEDSLCLRLLPLGLLRCSPTSPPAATDPRTPTGTPSAAAATARLLLLPHVPLPVHALLQRRRSSVGAAGRPRGSTEAPGPDWVMTVTHAQAHDTHKMSGNLGGLGKNEERQSLEGEGRAAGARRIAPAEQRTR